MHEIQRKIMRQLRFKPGARFSELAVEGVDSNKLTYHIHELEQNELVECKESGYYLTTKAKKDLNYITDDTAEIRKSPLPIVGLVVLKDGKFLLQERRKEPLYGFYILPGGKIEFGENFEDAVARELMEETNLKGDSEFLGVISSRTFDKGKLAYHIHMYCYLVNNPKGKLKETFEEGINTWVTEREMKALKTHPIDALVYEKRNQRGWLLEWDGYFDGNDLLRSEVREMK